VTGPQALQARLELIRRAQSSVDAQYYHLKSDATGRQFLRTLAEAAARGVRVRLLIDDLYTAGADDLLLGFAAHPNVELRLFNPFTAGRGRMATRILASLHDFDRVQRRMHNKMLIVDGAVAVAGGRNVGDEYYLRDEQSNFFDIDVMLVGAVVPRAQHLFDAYWNSQRVFPVQFIGQSERGAEELRSLFDEQTGQAHVPPLLRPQSDRLGNRSLDEELKSGRLQLHWGRADAFADAPEKIAGKASVLGLADPMGPLGLVLNIRQLVASEIAKSKNKCYTTTPYLIPGRYGMDRVHDLNRQGVRLSVLTNSLASTDEPLVHTAYRRYRTEMLRAGVELYEMSPLRGRRVIRDSLKGQPVFRLHTKSVVCDQSWIFLGSLNLDPRSHEINTEMGLLIYSPELARELVSLVELVQREAAYRVRLNEEGQLEWVFTDAAGSERHAEEPETGWWDRLLLNLLGPLIPEMLL
jgi:putative cardiolipin synthase